MLYIFKYLDKAAQYYSAYKLNHLLSNSVINVSDP